MTIYPEDIEKARRAFEAEIIEGGNVARKNSINLTKFKQEIIKGLTTTNNEDQWTFDYERYLGAISRGRFQSPITWGQDYYSERRSLKSLNKERIKFN